MNDNKKQDTLYEKTKVIKHLIENVGCSPFLISIEGINFKKITKNLTKPYSAEFNDLMSSIAKNLSEEIHGVYFSMVVGDRIILVADPKNDYVWCKGNKNKMISMISGLCSYYFQSYKLISPLSEQLEGHIGLFNVETLCNASKEEIISYLIWNQDSSRRVYNNLGTILIKMDQIEESDKNNRVYRKKFKFFYDLDLKLQKNLFKQL